jgi:HEAT repeat protein
MNGKMKTTIVLVLAIGFLVPARADAVARPGDAWQQQDSEAAYERGRAELNRGNYERAAELLGAYREGAPQGRNVGESLYWEAFALSRMESTASLKAALDAIRWQRERFPGAATAPDAQALRARVHGELARRGDAESVRWVYENTEDGAIGRAREAREQEREAREREREGREGEREVRDGEREVRDREREVRDREREVRPDEAKMAALQALMNMDSQAAIPILRRVVQNRDNSPDLRVQALFILSQQKGDEVMDLMLEAARNDPDQEVREQAVFWLSQVNSPESVTILESILSSEQDAALHEQALFAISQKTDERSRRILREFARSSSATPDMRAHAIFWLSQNGSPENAAFLREMWDTNSDPEVRESILFAMSQMKEDGNTAWLMSVALDTSEDTNVRNQALFAASQRSDVRVADLVGVYDRAPDRELKEQALFILSQSKDPAAFEKILDVVRNETNADLRQNAIFWLGQSGDPRAEQVLLEILDD